MYPPVVVRHFFFVSAASSFGVGSGGFTLVAFVGKVTTLTSVGVVDVESMRPAVAVVVIAAVSRVSVHVCSVTVARA
jgi:site-specific recombinase